MPPTQRLTFLGVELDTMADTMTLPADKLAELHTVVLEFQNKQSVSKKQLQRLAGIGLVVSFIRGTQRKFSEKYLFGRRFEI